MSVARQWVWGLPAPTRTQGATGDGAFGPGSGLSCGLGSFSSRGALIGFAVAPVAPGACDVGWRPGSISSFGYMRVPGTLCHRGLLLAWVGAAVGPWEVAAIPRSWRGTSSRHCGQGGCFCHAWRWADGGEEMQRSRQRGLRWWSASSTQVTALIPAPAGISGQLRGTAGSFSAPVC